MKLFLLFLTVPIVEIVVFLKVSQYIGIFYTVFFIIATAILGSIAVKQQGLGVLNDLRNQPDSRKFSLISGMLILLAGILLLTPGFITDGIGFSLLIPPVRKYILNKIETQKSQYQIF